MPTASIMNSTGDSRFPPRQHGDQTQHCSISKGEEIAALFMQVAEKKEKCLNFELTHWLTQYETIRKEVNFPEAGMIISCSTQIYGRKVDYLSDMVVNMNDDQKSREQKESAAANAKDIELEVEEGKSTSRKRVSRFNPQSGSDCFADLEFTVSDKRTLKLDALVLTPETVVADGRTKVQQMKDLCLELRTNPSRQRKQEILNRLRDEACIAPMLSSHRVARKNEILDLESGETIGRRQDYQTHQNYIDGRTGSLIAEHDLKRFFQRVDVMDFLWEQLESERERCMRQGMPAPADMLSGRARELKIFMPPEYLKDRYRINVNDTSDFDDAFLQARITNYNSDPILSLMDATEREKREKAIERDGHDSGMSGEGNDSRSLNDSTLVDEISFDSVLCSSRLNETSGEADVSKQSTENHSHQSTNTSNENPLEDELMALEVDPNKSKAEGEKSEANNSRLSVDEGIGVDRESPPRSSSAAPERYESNLFTTGTIVSRQTTQRTVQLRVNLFGLPEQLIRKNIIFALPKEFRKLKADMVCRNEDRTREHSRINIYSLHPTAPLNPLWTERPSTPELEDFLGFEDEEVEETAGKACSGRLSNRVLSLPARTKRPSSPDSDFAGFTEEEAAKEHTDAAKLMVLNSITLAKLDSPKRQQPAASPQVTPSRTLSCDSGISDSADRTKDLGVSKTTNNLKTIHSQHEDGFDSGIAEMDSEESGVDNEKPVREHTQASNARIQLSIGEAKERIEKVNEWHRRLKPALIESEKRNHFDIHAYGTEIIETFDRAAIHASGDLQRPTISLALVLQNKPTHSTARYFLSTLMLANTNNVEIVNKNRDALRLSTTEDIELRLISRKRHHQEMDALGELLPNDPDHDRRKRQNRKRKMSVGGPGKCLLTYGQNGHATASQDPCVRPDPSERLGLSSATADERNFIDNVKHLYPELDSEESRRKRMAFRRGIRNCAYGLVAGNESEKTQGTGKEHLLEAPPTIPVLQPQCNIQRRPSLHSPRLRASETLSFPEALVEEDEILTVNLLNNQAMIVPARYTDEMCSKSVFSLAESGYESMISEGNC